MEFFDGIFEKTRQLENKKQWAKPTVFNVSADDRNRTCTPLGHKNLNFIFKKLFRVFCYF